MNPRMYAVVVLTFSVFLGGCQEAPGEYYQGTINAQAPVEMPLGGAKACVGALEGIANYKSGQSTETSLLFAEPKWGNGATLTVDGQELTLTKTATGNGKPDFAESGDTWRWPQSEVSTDVLGWGHDSTLKTPGDPSITHSYTRMELTERFTRCGEPLRIRAIKKGTTLELVDTRATQGENAITFFVGAVIGFLCCMVAPIVLIIGFVIRRSKKQDA